MLSIGTPSTTATTLFRTRGVGPSIEPRPYPRGGNPLRRWHEVFRTTWKVRDHNNLGDSRRHPGAATLGTAAPQVGHQRTHHNGFLGGLGSARKRSLVLLARATPYTHCCSRAAWLWFAAFSALRRGRAQPRRWSITGFSDWASSEMAQSARQACWYPDEGERGLVFDAALGFPGEGPPRYLSATQGVNA